MISEQMQKILEPIVTLGGLLDGGYSLHAHITFVFAAVLIFIIALWVIALFHGGTIKKMLHIAKDVIMGVLCLMSIFFAGIGFAFFGNAIKRALFVAQRENP